MKWITRERPKVDRIACPWLIVKFIGKEAGFLYVPRDEMLRLAQETGAIAYEVPNVELGHHCERRSFDALLQKYQLSDPALLKLPHIVRGADTNRLDLAPEASGLYAISVELSRHFADDHEQLRYGMVVYDALHAWCRGGARP
ncbi:MAG: chromate resistance protein [Pandoraea sp.]|uniref:chromate resistance protein ChrB domain-containing protein n=1 Tax=Pandoraea sp. TaxID=1883445 RepID=UPI0012061B33|nr:chromate resistance protein ChrB domain-containing protein [Pandoraea sp.]TAM16885.1 MAG: chromate resistance protein [Pandoraea sp.]